MIPRALGAPLSTDAHDQADKETGDQGSGCIRLRVPNPAPDSWPLSERREESGVRSRVEPGVRALPVTAGSTGRQEAGRRIGIQSSRDGRMGDGRWEMGDRASARRRVDPRAREPAIREPASRVPLVSLWLCGAQR